MKVYGVEHANTMVTLMNFGNLLKLQNKLEEALTVYKDALKGFELCLGVEDPLTLRTVNN